MGTERLALRVAGLGGASCLPAKPVFNGFTQRRDGGSLAAQSGRSPMAEVPAGAPSSVAAPDRDVLLATKLHAPGPPPGFVPRTRLAAALDEGLARGLILVCAPAGAGKKALLAEWARRGDRPVGWLALDAGDNDPARFWRHVVAALDGARPGIGERVGPLLGPPAPPSFDGLLTALVNELTSQSGEVVLILDDYHLIDATQVHTSLAFLLEHLPPCLYLVLASRSDPPLPVARLRAGGQLAELRAGELRFTAEEAAALLCGATGADLPAAEVTALAARTEGWAAGLQLAGLSLRGQADPSGFVAAFSGTHRYVLDYLTEEVLERQPDPLRVFLLETSVLERLSGELCDAVTGRAGGQAMLDQVERAGLFLMPLDEVRGGPAERLPMSRADTITWARCSRPRAGWMQRPVPTSRHLRSAGRMAGPFCPPLASATWAWPRWPTSGTSWALPCGTAPRAFACAASSSPRRRWPLVGHASLA